MQLRNKEKHVTKEQRKPFVLELVEQHISKLQMTEEFENIRALVVVIVW